MKITIFAGKGGVGKSTVSGMYALLESITRGRKTLLTDNDGKRAHSISKVLNFKRKRYVGNILNETEVEKLLVSVINAFRFQSISETKERKIPVKEYNGPTKLDTKFTKSRGKSIM